jgi:regulator of protease activity HflC (stomatin/prohibitin superfamily)
MSDLVSSKQPAFSQVIGSPGFLKWSALAIAAIMMLYTLSDSYFIVQPTEMAGVRRLGTVRTAEPLTPGFYFKAPFIDKVDTLQVSIDTLRIDNLRVYTVDN